MAFLRPSTVAKIVGVSKSTLQRWRAAERAYGGKRGGGCYPDSYGPPWIKTGTGSVLYPENGLKAWMDCWDGKRGLEGDEVVEAEA